VLQQSQQPLPDTDLHVCLTTAQKNGILTKKMAFSQKKWHSHKKNGILSKEMAFSQKKWHSLKKDGILIQKMAFS